MSTGTDVLDKNPVSVGQITPLQPQTPVGVANKEIGHVISPASEFIKPSGAEMVPNISPEVSEHVEVKSDRPDLTQVTNVSHAGPHVPVLSSISNEAKLQMSKEEIEKQLKTGQDDDSGKWFAALWNKIISWGSKSR